MQITRLDYNLIDKTNYLLNANAIYFKYSLGAGNEGNISLAIPLELVLLARRNVLRGGF